MTTRYAAKHGPNLQNTLDAILNRDHFEAGNLRADLKWGAGRLPDTLRDLYSRTQSTYVVYSYGTPIAWFDLDRARWVVPAVKYSPTTTGHQSVVRRALGEMYGDGDYDRPES